MFKGDFELTVSYEILRADKPKTGSGAGLEIFLMTDTPTREALAFSRRIRSSGLDAYTSARLTTTNQGMRGNVAGLDLKDFPADGKTGKLRITRIGANAVLSVAEPTSKEFLHLYSVPLGTEDLTFLRLAVNNPSGSDALVDLRLHDFQVRSAMPGALKTNVPVGVLQNIPKTSTKGIKTTKGGIALALLVGLVITLSSALVIWLFVRRRPSNQELSAADGGPIQELPHASITPEKTSKEGKGTKPRVHLFGQLKTKLPLLLIPLILLALGLWIAAWFAGGGGETNPKDEIAKTVSVDLPTAFYHDFRSQPFPALSASTVGMAGSLWGQGNFLATAALRRARNQSLPNGLTLYNVKPNQLFVQPEGLSIDVAKHTPIDHKQGVGVRTTFGLTGDFEVTTAIEILQADTPPDGYGVGMGIYLAVPKSNPGAALARVVRSQNNQGILCNAWKASKEETMFPCTDKVLRLRLARTGTILSYSWAPGTQGGEFQSAGQTEFGESDIAVLRMAAFTGGSPCNVNVRVLDVRIRGQTTNNPVIVPPRAQASNAQGSPILTPRKGGLAAALAVGLVITLSLALVIWLFIRRRCE